MLVGVLKAWYYETISWFANLRVDSNNNNNNQTKFVFFFVISSQNPLLHRIFFPSFISRKFDFAF